jgi:DNA-binding protein H-NS
MAKANPTSLSELMTIRDILMGEIIEEYNDRFEKVGQELQAQRDALAAKEADLAARIQALDELLQTNSASLAAAINRKADDERHALGALFLSLGQRLKD